MQRIGEDGVAYDAIGVETIAQRGAHLAFAAKKDDRWVVVRDGVVSEPWEGIGEVAWSADGSRLAYSAQRGSAWYVVSDRVSAPYAGLRAGLFWDGDHLAYVALRGAASVFVRDGVEEARYDAIAEMTLAGDRWALFGRRAGRWFVVVDGKARGPYQSLASLRLSPRHVAYVARERDREFVVRDGAAEPASYDEVRQLVMRADGRVLYAARTNETWRVIAPGHAAGPFSAVTDLQSDGARYAYLARANGQTFFVTDDAVERAACLAGTLVLDRGWACATVTQGLRVAIDGIVGAPIDVDALASVTAFDAGPLDADALRTIVLRVLSERRAASPPSL